MAAVRQHLTHAPISEAVIDFRIIGSTDLNGEALNLLTQKLAPDYARKGPIFELQASFGLGPQGEGRSDIASQEIGVRLHSHDERYVAQIQRGGFSLSRMAPYQTWQALSTEARRLWALYVQAARPAGVSRVATRFINNLRLPMQPGEDFGVYLTKPPQVPDRLPQGISSFLQRVILHDPKSDIRATLTQALAQLPPGALPDQIPVILDIDVYRIAEFAVDGPELFDCLESLRVFKNLAFYESLTEKAVELYL